jgi:hypothetical protein
MVWQAMESLLSFPDEVLSMLLGVWLGVQDVTTLDTAHCSGKRSGLLRVLANAVSLNTVNASNLFERFNIPEKRRRMNLLMSWVLRRGVGVNSLFVTPALEDDNSRAEAYLRAKGDKIREIHYDIQVDVTPNWEPTFALINEHCPILQHLTCARNFTAATFCRIVATWPALTSIGFGKGVTDAGLLILAEGCREITSIHTDADLLERLTTEDGWDSFLSLRGPTLQSFVAPLSAFPDGVYRSFAAHCPQLRVLNIGWAGVSEAVALQVAQGCPLLQTVNLCSEPNVKASLIRALTSSGSLAELKTCSNGADAEEAVISALRCNLLLHKLSLQMVNMHRAMQEIAQRGAKLLELELVWWSELPAVESVVPLLISVAEGCPQLRTLKLRNSVWGSKIGYVTDAVLAAFATHCPQLTVIILDSCDQFTDTGVTALAHGCRWLRSFTFGSTGVTVTGMRAIGAHCPHVRKVTLQGGRLAAEVRAAQVFAKRVTVDGGSSFW